jgi:hypothetical protein
VTAALALSASVALAQPSPSRIAAGTILDFVSDDAINVQTVRPGGEYRAHLKSDLVLDGRTIAPAGSPARLIVVDRLRLVDGRTMLQVALSHFHLPPGDLPLAPVEPVVETIAAGTLIPAKTEGSVEHIDDRLVIRIPLPFLPPNDTPFGFYTPVPARTAAPRAVGERPPRRPTPTPAATAPPAPAPVPSPSG